MKNNKVAAGRTAPTENQATPNEMHERRKGSRHISHIGGLAASLESLGDEFLRCAIKSERRVS